MPARPGNPPAVHRSHPAHGIPYLAPEWGLLFKAKAARPKDRADFGITLPLLSGTQRSTLADLLARVHPGHPWLAALRG
ncbi:hypothetical protein [Streptomyces sp. NPDC051561]|uniref:hypothetical protein n=1 Tax=Streptomyces sp. NPDC051561 TaxID=3365658 RepID=UPI0037BA3397